jgi:Family of unknown function (DUF6455)
VIPSAVPNASPGSPRDTPRALRYPADRLRAMLHEHGLDLAGMRRRAWLELFAAEMRCAACAETRRCGLFLAGAADASEAFCPNAGLFRDLREREAVADRAGCTER